MVPTLPLQRKSVWSDRWISKPHTPCFRGWCILCRAALQGQQDRLCRRCRSHCYHQTTTGMETAAAATEAVGRKTRGVCRVKYLDGSRHGRVGKHQPAYDVNSWFLIPVPGLGVQILISKGVIDFIALWLATYWQNNRRTMKVFYRDRLYTFYHSFFRKACTCYRQL